MEGRVLGEGCEELSVGGRREERRWAECWKCRVRAFDMGSIISCVEAFEHNFLEKEVLLASPRTWRYRCEVSLFHLPRALVC